MCLEKWPRLQSQLDLSKPRLTSHQPVSTRSCVEFDPRRSSDRKLDAEFYRQKMEELKAIFPQTGMTHVAPIPDSAPPAVQEMEVETTPDPILENISAMVFSPGNMPPSVIDDSLAVTIEARTRGQRTNKPWCLLHKGRITSSNSGRVMAAGKSQNHLIAEIINGSSLNKYSNLPVQVKWGQYHEDTARADYIKFKEASGTYLGASCDGIVIDKSMPCDCQKEVEDLLSIPSFYMQSSDSCPALCKTHHYYAQVQGEMAVTGLPWCDFVVWTGAHKNNLFVQRIYFDANFVSDMLRKLKGFYNNFIK
ncbi:hypothetical protein MAR_036858 [Mya arenaria]|uniref:YqaJ viral recombinase domain-containing protein n=1 Tax=Mya arenaria TaxID=6604 RepID=A0ABY7FPD4_MYAAR|nr:hypothetical protein MAR_036858 [Mya arenaria]